MVKYISETLGYTIRGQGIVRTYSIDEIDRLVSQNGIVVDYDTILAAKSYFDKRAALLNDFVCYNLMDANTAREAFQNLYPLYQENCFQCKIPMNKQKGAMKQIAFFTAIINILAEDTIRRSSIYDGSLGFNDDPRGLVYVFDDEKHIIGASSRRFDGAFPNIINPRIVWEIKEYYYATTFGSRVADGVYETQLDGYEFRDVSYRSGKPITHVFFLDAYKTWWIDGKSYLCRIIDILNSGLVDEVIVGKEVFTRWPELLSSIIEE
ncbi:hypothetical protein [Bacteroides acidifaciens]|uniref:DUF7687 domain-containing protein n=2 Tax=Bacteria TaxID=2 RepID=UPI0025B303E4|nr:hypothetical protein [Bacteroides acidifaciens]